MIPPKLPVTLLNELAKRKDMRTVSSGEIRTLIAECQRLRLVIYQAATHHEEQWKAWDSYEQTDEGAYHKERMELLQSALEN